MEKRWWVKTKSFFGLPDIILRRRIRGRHRYRRFYFKFWHALIIVPFLTLTALGAMCLALFFATTFGLTATAGIVDEHSSAYNQLAALPGVNGGQVLGTQTSSASALTAPAQIELLATQVALAQADLVSRQQLLCDLSDLVVSAPYEAGKISAVFHLEPALLGRLIYNARQAGKLNLTPDLSWCLQQLQTDSAGTHRVWENIVASSSTDQGQTVFAWLDPVYWEVARQALATDQASIKAAAAAVDINPRLVVASLLVEQLRLYFSGRELFQQFFQPLKIFANSTQVSLGVMAIKPETAQAIEAHLSDPNSPFYLGEAYAHLLDYVPGENPSSARVSRLSSEENHHYWSYLYGAIYLKQLMTQWEKAGYSLLERPEIISTLYNVGFSQSQPKSAPQVGGSKVVVNGQSYSFGHLAGEFYYSLELLGEYPLL